MALAQFHMVVTSRQGRLYYVEEGYYFRQSKKDNVRHLLYLECANTHCTAKANINEDLTGPLRQTKPHTNMFDQNGHPPDPRTPQQITLKREILYGSEALNGQSKKRFYDNKIANVSVHVAKEMPYAGIYKSMKSRQYRAGDRVPEDMEALGQLILQSPEYRDSIELDQFYLAGNEQNIIFVCPVTSELFNMPDIAYTIDGTFKVCPKKPKIYQLFTLGGMYNKTFFAIAYALMKRKNEENYTFVFNTIINHFPHWNPGHIISDFEIAPVNALRGFFPNAKYQGCWFHFTQAIEKKTKSLRAYQNEEVRSLIKKIMAWPLLPENLIQEGFLLITAIAAVINLPEVDQLIGYVDGQWLTRVGEAQLTVANSPYRTNNHHESFHRNIMLHMVDTRSGTNPNIKVFLSGLKKIQHEQATKFLAARDGKTTSFPKDKKWEQLNARITQAHEKLGNPEMPEYGVLEFLEEMAHNHNFHVIGIEMGIEDDEEEV